MNLGTYLKSECIATHLEVKDKWDLLDQIGDLFERTGALTDQPITKMQLVKALREREESQSTGLGDGIAIPHARIEGVSGMTMALVTLKEPIPFDSLDGQPVSLIWVILVAQDKPTLALQAYSKILELMQDEAIRNYFQSIDNPSLIKDYIYDRKIPVGGVLTARDIMRPPTTHILPATSLREVVREMRKHQIEAVAVEDDDRRVLGEITCDWLFQYGMPDFFNQLQSVAFISKFDPFEKYFSEEAEATAGDVMQNSQCTVQPDATMLEVVFALTVEKHAKIYVVEEGCRIGTIDRTEVLDRILDF